MKTAFHYFASAAMGLCWIGVPLTAAAETLYVQSVAAPIRAQPGYAATVLTTVARGTALKLTAQSDINRVWQAVIYQHRTGWVPRAMLGVTEPKPRLSRTNFTNLFGHDRKAIAGFRKRASANNPDKPDATTDNPEARIHAPRDEQALELVESMEISDQEISNFHANLQAENKTTSQ